MPERYVKLTKDQAEAPLEDIRPGELNLPVHVPQVQQIFVVFALIGYFLFFLALICVCPRAPAAMLK